MRARRYSKSGVFVPCAASARAVTREAGSGGMEEKKEVGGVEEDEVGGVEEDEEEGVEEVEG